MALPDISKASSLELLALVENRELVKILLANNRITEGRSPDDVPSPQELVFLATLSWGLVIKQALAAMKPVDFLNMWGKQTGHLRGRGKPPRPIYRLAWLYHDIYKLKLMEVYRRLVLPHFFETGEIAREKDGQPNPTQDKDAQEDFLKAMAGFRQKDSK